MKSFKSIVLAIAALFYLSTAHAQHKDWKELEDFHAVMSKSFHPSEEGNLQPLKNNAADLLAKVKIWEAAPVPADYKAGETKKTLMELLAKCEEINAAVNAKKSDAELKTLITQAHEIFHKIVEKCRKPESVK